MNEYDPTLPYPTPTRSQQYTRQERELQDHCNSEHIQNLFTYKDIKWHHNLTVMPHKSNNSVESHNAQTVRHQIATTTLFNLIGWFQLENKTNCRLPTMCITVKLVQLPNWLISKHGEDSLGDNSLGGNNLRKLIPNQFPVCNLGGHWY